MTLLKKFNEILKYLRNNGIKIGTQLYRHTIIPNSGTSKLIFISSKAEKYDTWTKICENENLYIKLTNEITSHYNSPVIAITGDSQIHFYCFYTTSATTSISFPRTLANLDADKYIVEVISNE